MTTAREIVCAYITHRPGVKSEKHWEGTQGILTAFLERLGPKALAECKPFDVADFIAANPQWLSDWTKRRVCAAIQRPFNWAVKMGLCPANPFRGYSNPSGPAGRPMSDEEFAALMGLATLPFARILHFLRLTGCRPCEARQLCWTHINTESGVAVLREHKTARTRKDKQPRVVILTRSVVDLLVEVLESSETGWGGDEVFINNKGKPWTRNALGLQIGRLRKKAGLPMECKLYGLRHRFGTVVAASGLPMKALADLMGHTSTKMTEHYIHLAGQTDYLREALEQTEGL